MNLHLQTCGFSWPPGSYEIANNADISLGSYHVQSWDWYDGWWVDETNSDTETYNAQTVVKLQTGGKALSQRQNLFQLMASATQQHPARYNPDSSWTDSYTTAVPAQNIQVLGLNLNTNGYIYKILADGQTVDVTPKVKDVNDYTFTVDAQKYLSHFEVFVCQPYPDYQNDWWNAAIPGYPYVSSADIGGHAWWKLTTDAPTDAVNQFANANASQWINTEVGYGADPDLSVSDWLNAILNVTSPTGSGVLPFTNTHTWTVHRTYAIGFPGLIAGLNHTEHIHEYPGTYDLRYHNCVTEVIITGGAAGVALPSDWIPEIFGFDLPPDSP